VADSIIAAIQAKYTAITTYSGKPAVLWFGVVRPKNPDGTAVAFPFVRFYHLGTSHFSTQSHGGFETHKYRFEAYAETPQGAELVHDRTMYNGFAPDAAGANGGFHYATSLDLPTKYSFMSFEPVGDWVCDELGDEFGTAGTPIARLTWDMSLMTDRATWS
jgi:hypothetical protein